MQGRRCRKRCREGDHLGVEDPLGVGVVLEGLLQVRLGQGEEAGEALGEEEEEEKEEEYPATWDTTSAVLLFMPVTPSRAISPNTEPSPRVTRHLVWW